MAAALRAGCGSGSGSDTAADPAPQLRPAPLSIKTVTVVGAGYSDLGAWGGAKVGLRDSRTPTGFPLFTELVGDDSRIVVVPFHDDFVNVVAHLADHGLTNVTGQVCRQAGAGSCDAAQLDASPPPGMSAGWWQTWLFTYGTALMPKGQQLLAESVDRALVRAGWR